MIIEFANNQLKATWPRYEKSIHDEIVARLKAINGTEFDKVGKCWWVPVAQADRLMDMFPRASYDVDAIYAATDAQAWRVHAFYNSLAHLGIKLGLDASGTIVAIGQSISPLVQSLVDDRADALRPLVLEAMEQPPAQLTARAQRVPVTEQEHKWGSWMAGVKAAAKKEAEEEKFKYPRRRTKKTKQEELS